MAKPTKALAVPALPGPVPTADRLAALRERMLSAIDEAKIDAMMAAVTDKAAAGNMQAAAFIRDMLEPAVPAVAVQVNNAVLAAPLPATVLRKLIGGFVRANGPVTLTAIAAFAETDDATAAAAMAGCDWFAEDELGVRLSPNGRRVFG